MPSLGLWRLLWCQRPNARLRRLLVLQCKALLLDQLQLRRDVLQDNMLKLHRLHLDLLLAPFALLQLQRQLLREPPGQLPRQLRKQNQDGDEDEERGEGEPLLLLLLVHLHLQH